MSRRAGILCLVPSVLIGCSPDLGPTAPEFQLAKVGAPIRTAWPSADDPGPPYYARIEPTAPHVYHDEEWAVIVFYRAPSCVPTGFDLLQFFDPPSAFGCALHVSGSSIWEQGVGVGAPKVVTTSGAGAVPVWLLPSDVVLQAIGDGTLTIGELGALPGRLSGSAVRFHEVLHPHPLPPVAGGGGHPNPKLIMTAQGSLEDGRRFRVHLSRGDTDEIHALEIVIR